MKDRTWSFKSLPDSLALGTGFLMLSCTAKLSRDSNVFIPGQGLEFRAVPVQFCSLADQWECARGSFWVQDTADQTRGSLSLGPRHNQPLLLETYNTACAPQLLKHYSIKCTVQLQMSQAHREPETWGYCPSPRFSLWHAHATCSNTNNHHHQMWKIFVPGLLFYHTMDCLCMWHVTVYGPIKVLHVP